VIFLKPATEVPGCHIFQSVRPSRSILLALVAAGLGLAVATRPARGETSDATVVIGWVRWAHELSRIGHDAASLVTRVLTSAHETADAVSTLLASADADPARDAACDAILCPEPEPVATVRWADLPARAETPELAPLPSNATIRRVSARCEAVQQEAWRDASALRAEMVLNHEMSSHGAARLSREARRLVRVQM